MKIKQVRNATLLVEFGGSRFLIDPFLAEKDTYPGIPGTVNDHIRNPRVELATPMEEILDVDAVIVTHTHEDHWDEAAIRIIPKDLPLFAQHEDDAALIREQGFTDVRLLRESTQFQQVTIIKAPGQHGSDEAISVMGDILGQVCGLVFQHIDERVLYVAGDTIWNQYVESNLEAYTPDVIVLNAGDAQVPGVGSIIMNTEDVKRVYDASPQATLIASHMETVNHCVLTRAELKAFSEKHGMTDRLVIPADNESYYSRLT
ncbi:MBL fold metallo-hydrolase [Halomonas janggokensis]|uniref:MBL fold metallo-hydrolase n=1 Tax=Vreelandella janggokensis TaxID=370767 RepID=A0ABT4IW44_9GAMM|nr:MBL fold metallo-hydrolase [Halomonas janggokensis]MCZ0927214.1 MBL fold metallo-hydrolase [Halomonas janggokensis]MCZ0929722.1 MBL fold metallo-hydrolase [Halomonas janggokensis]